MEKVFSPGKDGDGGNPLRLQNGCSWSDGLAVGFQPGGCICSCLTHAGRALQVRIEAHHVPSQLVEGERVEDDDWVLVVTQHVESSRTPEGSDSVILVCSDLWNLVALVVAGALEDILP